MLRKSKYRFLEKSPWKTFFIKKKMDIKKYVHFQKKTINNRPPTFYTFIYGVNNMKIKYFPNWYLHSGLK